MILEPVDCVSVYLDGEGDRKRKRGGGELELPFNETFLY